MAEDPYWKNVLTIVPIVASGVATIIYGLRLFARRTGTSSGWQLEDLLMGIGVFVSYGATIFVVYSPFTSFSILSKWILTLTSCLQWRRTPDQNSPSR